MFSRCSHCQSQQEVVVDQLRRGRGLLVCPNCGKRFDALATLSEQPEAEIPERNSADLLENIAGKPSRSAFWGAGIVLSALTLVAQGIYFEGDWLMRQPISHALWRAVCEPLQCRLPEYRNLDEWSISHGDLQAGPNRGYVFTAAITNQAEFSQRFPNLKLVLHDLHGRVVAERIFSGRFYAPADRLVANETTEIRLNLVVPSSTDQIGGYTLALL